MTVTAHPEAGRAGAPPPARPLRVLAHVHFAPPLECAGSEIMLHNILRCLIAAGHEARVICDTGDDRVYRGVEITALHWRNRDARTRLLRELYGDADVVITHLDRTYDAIKWAKQCSPPRPLVHLIHNHRQMKHWRLTVRSCALAVFNSAWVQQHNELDWRGRWVVVHPPLLPDEYATTPGDAITMVNLTPTKGVATFYALAERNPDRQFLGVIGGYYRDQHVIRDDLPNVEIVDNTANIRDDVYRRSRIVLMPSDYESWGLVAVEAICSGIPVIAHPTLGLRESLGDAGIFCDRADTDAWQVAIEALDDHDTYTAAGAKAKARADELGELTRHEMTRFESALQAVIAGEPVGSPA